MQPIKRFLIASLLCCLGLLIPQKAESQTFALVQHTSGFTFSTSTSKAYSSNNTAGNLLVALVWVNTGSSSTATVSDPSNGTWSHAVTPGAYPPGIFYVCSAVGGVAPTVSVSGGGGNWYAIHIMEFSGNKTSGCLDQTGFALNTTTTNFSVAISSGSLTTTDVLIYGAGVTGGATTYTVPSGETGIEFVNGSFGLTSQSAYNNAVVSSGTPSMNTTGSASSSTYMVVAAFKLGGAAAASRHRLINN
jgi:hypothetical protein